MKAELLLPEDFRSYEWEVESKGWFVAKALFDGQQFSLAFYDPIRLAQDVHDELESNFIFCENNVVVVTSVNGVNMKKAVVELHNSGKYQNLRCDVEG